MKYALLDDNLTFHKKLKTLFHRYNSSDSLDCYHRIQDFLSHTSKYDILFLDIDLKSNISGIELAKRLYKDNSNLIIIYITDYNHLVYEANGLNVFRFIPKMYLEEKLPTLFTEINNEINSQKYITFNDNIIRTNDILYFEKYGHNVYIHLIKNSLLIKQTTLSKIFNNINNNQFAYINRSIIVNIQHVINIHNNTIYLDITDQNLDISFSKRKEVITKFKEYNLK